MIAVIDSIKGERDKNNILHSQPGTQRSLLFQNKLWRDVFVSSDCKDSAVTWDIQYKTHEISLRNESRQHKRIK